jgi:hypothetical protein
VTSGAAKAIAGSEGASADSTVKRFNNLHGEAIFHVTSPGISDSTPVNGSK